MGIPLEVWIVAICGGIIVLGLAIWKHDQIRLSIAKLGLNFSTQRRPQQENDSPRRKVAVLNKAKFVKSSADEIAGASYVNAAPGSSGAEIEVAGAAEITGSNIGRLVGERIEGKSEKK